MYNADVGQLLLGHLGARKLGVDEVGVRLCMYRDRNSRCLELMSIDLPKHIAKAWEDVCR